MDSTSMHAHLPDSFCLISIVGQKVVSKET